MEHWPAAYDEVVLLRDKTYSLVTGSPHLNDIGSRVLLKAADRAIDSAVLLVSRMNWDHTLSMSSAPFVINVVAYWAKLFDLIEYLSFVLNDLKGDLSGQLDRLTALDDNKVGLDKPSRSELLASPAISSILFMVALYGTFDLRLHSGKACSVCRHLWRVLGPHRARRGMNNISNHIDKIDDILSQVSLAQSLVGKVKIGYLTTCQGLDVSICRKALSLEKAHKRLCHWSKLMTDVNGLFGTKSLSLSDDFLIVMQAIPVDERFSQYASSLTEVHIEEHVNRIREQLPGAFPDKLWAFLDLVIRQFCYWCFHYYGLVRAGLADRPRIEQEDNKCGKLCVTPSSYTELTCSWALRYEALLRMFEIEGCARGVFFRPWPEDFGPCCSVCCSPAHHEVECPVTNPLLDFEQCGHDLGPSLFPLITLGGCVDILFSLD